MPFTLHADLTSFTGLAGGRIVEPGDVELRVGASSADVRDVLDPAAGRPAPRGRRRPGAASPTIEIRPAAAGPGKHTGAAG